MLDYYTLPYMLGNIASDLDSMRSDLEDKQEPCSTTGQTQRGLDTSGDNRAAGKELLSAPGAPAGLLVADTLDKDSFLSCTGSASCKPQSDALGSSASLLCGGEEGAGCVDGTLDASDINISNTSTDGGLHSRAAGTQRDDDAESSVDSGHGGTGRSCFRSRGRICEMGEHPRSSPLVFDPQHFSGNSPINAGSWGRRVVVDMSSSTEEFRPISTLERLVKTNSIWLLASLSRAGAVHILKDRAMGNFIVRKSSQPHSLALSVQSTLCGHPAVDHYLIQGTPDGFRLEGSAHFFHSIPALISYYIENIDEIPYHLQLPLAIQQARSTRKLASLDMLGQDFWSSSVSRKASTLNASFNDGQLHKSQSEPINIQNQPASSHAFAQEQIVNNTPPSRSTEGFSHFMQAQTEVEKQLPHSVQSSSIGESPLTKDQASFVSSGDSAPAPLLQVTTAVVVSVPSSNSTTSLSRLTASGALPSAPRELSPPSQFPSPQNREQSQRIHEPSPEPIYSVSKKQLKKQSQCSQGVVDTDSNEVGQNLTPSHAVKNLDTCASLAYDVSAFTLRQRPKPQADLFEGDSPYRHSTTNQIASTVLSSDSSCDQGLSRTANTKGIQEAEKVHASDGGNTFVPRPKANLYFTTNLNLLEIPENTYFTSNLSDRLSDYEDIWRTSSCAESDQDQYRHGNKQFEGSTTRMISDPRSVMDARFNHQQQQQQQQPSLPPPKDKSKSIPGALITSGRRKVLRKTSRDSPISRRIPAERDAVTGGTTGLTALEQARKIAGSTSDEDGVVSPSLYAQNSPLPVAHVKGIRRLMSVYDYEDEGDTNQEDIHQQHLIGSPQAALATPLSGSARTNRSVAVSNTAIVTNTNSIHILPSRPNQIKFITSHSLDFSSPAANNDSSQSKRFPCHALSSVAFTPTPTSSKSLPASIAQDTAQTCVFTTTMAVHVAQTNKEQATPISSTARIKAAPSDKSLPNGPKVKEKPSFISPLSRLSRLKSSSESSLATVSSPLYAEPADAVKLRDKHGKTINIQIRRQSAPSGPQQLLAAARNREKLQVSSKVSQNPKLDTILSPGAVATDKKTSTETSNRFTFEEAHACSKKNELASCHRLSITRSQSLRTPYEQGQFQRKQSWKERLNRLKLGTRVLTRNLTPPSAPSACKTLYQQQMSSEAYDNLNIHSCLTYPQLPASVIPPPSSPGRFPVLGHFFVDPRASIFSESSTVQDLISCAHPELSVRPIVNTCSPHVIQNNNVQSGGSLTREAPAAPSEYDNLGIYRASTHSSVGTVYLPPWESSAASHLMQKSQQSSHETNKSQNHCPPPLPSQPPLQELSSSSLLSKASHKLPPAMNFQERIARWQESNTTYLHHQETRVPTSPSAGGLDAKGCSSFSAHQRHTKQRQETESKNESPLLAQHNQFLQQQQQLLHHQHQVKNNGRKNNGSNENKSARQDVMQKQKDFQDSSGHCEPLPPLSPVSPVSSNLANSVQLPTAVNAATPAPLASRPIPVSSPTSSHRLSSHCPDVVHCHSTPVPPTPSSSSFLNPTGHGRDLDNAAAHMIGTDDVLFGGSFNMASPELQRHISPILSQEFPSHHDNKAPGARIREYIFKLSSDHQTIFGSTIENFIQCTLESQETNPDRVMRNVRQFMTGIKNYLVKHGEGMLEDLIERERNKLGANEILNIDAIIEQALHVCVLKPLKYHIYHLFVEKYNANGALEQLSRNIKYARTKSAEDLGVKPGLKVPGHIDMEVIKYYLDLMQRSYSPLQKLQNLLKATSTIYHCVQGKQYHFPSRGPSSLGADDFLPMLIYVLVHCGLVAAEIEADFMWGLLQQSLLTGEGGYYLTTLSSAVLVLKNFQDTHDLAPAQHQAHLPTLSDMQGFLKIAIPDELHDSINWKTLPVRPNMNTKDVCSLIAHKFKVTNPQDYGLYLLCDGQESQMAEGDCPQVIKGNCLALKKSCCFAFKRLDANIAWPKQIQDSAFKDSV